jgi:hypothetical protein
MSLASSRAVIGRFIGVAGGEAKDGVVEEGVGGIYDGSGLVIIDRGFRSGCRKYLRNQQRRSHAKDRRAPKRWRKMRQWGNRQWSLQTPLEDGVLYTELIIVTETELNASRSSYLSPHRCNFVMVRCRGKN